MTVSVEVVAREVESSSNIAASRYDHYVDFIGALDDLPEDWSENHDEFLREECGQ